MLIGRIINEQLNIKPVERYFKYVYETYLELEKVI